MRWTRPGAQAVATLRALHRSHQWDAWWHIQPYGRTAHGDNSRKADWEAIAHDWQEAGQMAQEDNIRTVERHFKEEQEHGQAEI